MDATTELIENSIRKNPLALLTISNPALLNIANNYLPYSAGFEFEVKHFSSFNQKEFDTIPNILHVSCDNCEKRFRIPNGVNGFICLYFICEKLKLHCNYDPASSIHYHTDMTDCYKKITDKFINDNNKYVISEVSTWGNDFSGGIGLAKCTRNKGWVRYHDLLKTLEIRLGEITFDYTIIVNRLLHCQRIVKQLKKNLNFEEHLEFAPQTVEANLEYLNNLKTPFGEIKQKIKEKVSKLRLDKEVKEEEEILDTKQILSNRVIKF